MTQLDHTLGCLHAHQLDLILHQLPTDCIGSRVSDNDGDDGQLTAGQIAGIVVAVMVCAVGIGVAVIVYVKRRAGE